MADEQGSDPKSLEVRVSQLEDAVRDLTKQLSGAQQYPPCGGQAPCAQYVPCITHYVPCIQHAPCAPWPPCGASAFPPCGQGHHPPCGGGWGPCA